MENTLEIGEEMPVTQENIVKFNETLDPADKKFKEVKKFDEDENLELFSYITCTDEDSKFLKSCRGVIFDKKTGSQVTPLVSSFSYTQEYTSEDVFTDEHFDSLKETDLTKYKFYDSHEGAVVRIFQCNGKVYLSTNHKLDANKSKWSSTVSYGEMFHNALEHMYKTNETFKKQVGDLGSNEDLFTKFVSSCLDMNNQYLFLVRNNDENRIVCDSLENPTIFHVGTYTPEGFSMLVDSSIPYAQSHKFQTVRNVIKYVETIKFEEIQGLVVFPPIGDTFKIYNLDYFDLYNARGNEASIKYRYLQVRMDERQRNMLYFLYPGSKEDFDNYENMLYSIAQVINYNYILRFIKKSYISLPMEEYHVMKACHQWHLTDRANNRISVEKVLNEINQQPSTKLNKMIKRFKVVKNMLNANPQTPINQDSLPYKLPKKFSF
jgi:hypothetical protein